MAPYRTLDVVVVSAKDLKNVNFFSKMNVYAVVSLSGDPSLRKSKVKTGVNCDGGSNPTWNFPIKFTIDEALAQQNRLTLVFKLRCERPLCDKDVGKVSVPVKELIDTPGDGMSMQFVNYQVCGRSGKPKGMLTFSYKFREEVEHPKITESEANKADQPVMGYPAAVAGTNTAPNASPYAAAASYPPPPPQGYGYPPPGVAAYGAYPPPHGQPAYAYPPPPPGQAAYGYPPPPPQGYGYPQPPPQGYGYGPPPTQGQGYPPLHGPPYAYPPPPPPAPGQAGYGYPPPPQVYGSSGYPQVVQPEAPKKNKFWMRLGEGTLQQVLARIAGDTIDDEVASVGGGVGDGGYDGGFDDAGGLDF